MAARRTTRRESKPRLPRKPRRSEAKLAFEALTIEGGLLSPDWLARIAALNAGGQSEADYRIPRGLQLRDEIGRYWRIAQAYWSDFAAGCSSATKPEAAQALSARFILALLRESFGFASLAATEPLVIAEHSYPIGFTALGGRVPVVIAPAGVGLDTLAPAFGDGGRRRSAFGLAQEYLNAAENATWGLATDGLVLRILRDNASLTRPAWIEADLSRIFTEERYADFAALWLLAHETRFGRVGQTSTECMLEAWRHAGREEGTRAREHLRRGVEETLLVLGQGFLAHSENTSLREALQNGTLSPMAYFQELLRLVYRLIFLLTVEERGLLHPEGSVEGAHRLYYDGYSLRRLRERSIRRSAHDRFFDLWEATKIVFRGLAAGESRLALPALAGIFAPVQCPMLDAARLENRALLLAVFHLSWLREASGLVRVNWRDMGPEELGSVYESLLELVPQVTQGGRTFAFATGGETKGNARKTSGSYYTPDSLVQVLLDSALEPVVANTLAVSPERPVEALLELSVVDPACGSGHFLLAAARRLAGHVARFQANGTPSAAEYRHALRQVVGRCLYGVDLNPMAVELCKVSLWMEAVEPGLPLTFLDAHIRHGNALLGTTPELMAKGIPDAAWEPIEGDDRKVASGLKKRNKRSEGGQRALDTLWTKPTESETAAVARAVAELEASPDTNVEALSYKAERWEDLLDSGAYRHQKLVADAWCASFVWPKEPGPLQDAAPTNDVWIQIRDRRGQPNTLTAKTTEELAEQYQFFHWYLAFPQVFARGGFDVVLGNPPWERVKLQEQEFFASRSDEIANAPHAAARKELIAELPESNPVLWSAWRAASREADGQSHFVRASGRYVLCSKGDVNTYALFSEHNRAVLGRKGRAGFIVPTGIATDDTTKEFFHDLISRRQLAAFYGFENEGKLFKGNDHRLNFCLLSVSITETPTPLFSAYLRTPEALRDPERVYPLGAADIALLNPNTGTCPVFRTRRDAKLNLGVYRRAGVLWRENDQNGNPWSLRFMRMFDMANDSGLFQIREAMQAAASLPVSNCFEGEGGVYVPLLEAKMIYHFNHRFADFALLAPKEREHILPQVPDQSLASPYYVTMPRYWVSKGEVSERLAGVWNRHWLLGWRDITDARSSVRTVVASLIPRVATADTFLLAMPSVEPRLAASLYANLCSFVLDYAGRQKVGGTHLKYHVMKQLPALPPKAYEASAAWSVAILVSDWLLPRVLELTYTAWDLEPFARDVGYDSPPFRWDPERRFLLRAELDAAFFHLYGLSRDDTAYILDTFPIVCKNDEKAHGEYRTKRVILEIYDAMALAAHTGQPYATRLAPPPADPRVAHPPRTGVVVPLPSRPLALPAWRPEILVEVAARAEVRLAAGTWATSLSGVDLGMTALASVLRNLPKPSSREDVERAIVLVLLPRLMLPHFDSMSAPWRTVIGRENLDVSTVSVFEIPWNAVIRRAIQQNVLEEVDGRWCAGTDVADASSPEFEARTLVVLAWLATAPAKDAEVTKQMEDLNAA
jgi:hypothetical protein